MGKKLIAMLLALAMILAVMPAAVFAADAKSLVLSLFEKEQYYKNLVVLGDSLCLGFSTKDASMTATDTFDIISNVYRAANDHNSLVAATKDTEGNIIGYTAQEDTSHSYTHAYPTVLAKKLGIDTFQNNEIQNIFTPGDAYDDVFNFGVCAAWAGDMHQILSNPFYTYDYYINNVDNDASEYFDYYATTRFKVPFDVRVKLPIVVNDPSSEYYNENFSKPGYRADDKSTWQFAETPEVQFNDEIMTADWWSISMKPGHSYAEAIVGPYSDEYKEWLARQIDYLQNDFMSGNLVAVMKTAMVELSEGDIISADIAESASLTNQWGWGSSPAFTNIYKQVRVNNIIVDCFDSEGNVCDMNRDGECDSDDYCYVSDPRFSDSRNLPTIANPLFTRYYYDYITDKVKNGDLVLLAIGGNDIYHTFQDQYMANGMQQQVYDENGDPLYTEGWWGLQPVTKVNVLGTVLYYLNYALQLDMSITEIINYLPTVMDMSGINLNLSTLASLGLINEDSEIMNRVERNGKTVSQNAEEDEGASIKDIFSTESIEWLLDYYSEEKVTAGMQQAIADYKTNYDLCIRDLIGNENHEGGLMNKDAELVLVGHYNPFGAKNYGKMLLMSLLNGNMLDHLVSNTSVIAKALPTLVKLAKQENPSVTNSQYNAVLDETSALLANLSDIVKSIGNEEMTQFIMDLSFPMVVLLMSSALKITYEEFNSFVAEEAEKYHIAWVDISQAPTNGIFDPHPTEVGHEWIADKIYDAVNPVIKTSVSLGTGIGLITTDQETRLGETVTIKMTPLLGSKIGDIYIDGDRVAESDSKYGSAYTTGQIVFTNVVKTQSVSVRYAR